MKHEWMKRMAALTFGLLIAQAGFAAGVAPARAAEAINAGATTALKTDKEKASYGIGVETGRNLKQRGYDVDQDLLIRGLKDALSDNSKLLLTDSELNSVLKKVTTEMRITRRKDRMIAAQENKKKGEEFLAANKAKEGVVALPSGLQYKILKAGDGKKPTAADTVECQYRGTLLDGTEFVNTYRTGQADTLGLSDMKVIPGLREALKLMPVGSKWQLFIPPQLAFVARGSGSIIGPYATLIYEVELIAVK